MAQIGPGRSSSVTIAAGVSGAVAAHLVGYALAFPSTAERSSVLAETGHGYFSLAVWVGAGAAALAFARVSLRGAARDGRAAPPSAVPRFRTLLATQVAMFLTVEALERLAAGEPLGPGMAHGRGMAVSLIVQVAVAALFVLVLAGTERLCTALGRSRRRPGEARAPRRLRPRRAAVRSGAVPTSGPPRAPPRRPAASTVQPAR